MGLVYLAGHQLHSAIRPTTRKSKAPAQASGTQLMAAFQEVYGQEKQSPSVLCDPETGWCLPETPPPALGLTDDQYRLLKKILPTQKRMKGMDTPSLGAAGYCCWYEFEMHSLTVTILMD
jgi:hypothetical protein